MTTCLLFSGTLTQTHSADNCSLPVAFLPKSAQPRATLMPFRHRQRAKPASSWPCHSEFPAGRIMPAVRAPFRHNGAESVRPGLHRFADLRPMSLHFAGLPALRLRAVAGHPSGATDVRNRPPPWTTRLARDKHEIDRLAARDPFDFFAAARTPCGGGGEEEPPRRCPLAPSREFGGPVQFPAATVRSARQWAAASLERRPPAPSSDPLRGECPPQGRGWCRRRSNSAARQTRLFRPAVRSGLFATEANLFPRVVAEPSVSIADGRPQLASSLYPSARRPMTIQEHSFTFAGRPDDDPAPRRRRIIGVYRESKSPAVAARGKG